MSRNSKIKIKNESEEFNNNEIDIFSVFKALLRNKKFISQITLISVISGILYSFSIRKVWQGEFQIVLTKENKNNLINQSDLLQGFAMSGLNLQSDGDPLKTEVGILKSPLVLDSVFNYVKKAKSSNKKDNIDNLSFRKWKNTYLNINLEKGTSILNLSYRDTNRELILPVLEEISKSYQKYSGRSRIRQINLEKIFLEEQIQIYKDRSTKSARDAQEFGFKENLSILQGNSETDEEIPSQINIEAIRIKSANSIRDIDVQLQTLQEINTPETLIYISNIVPELLQTRLPEELREIDNSLKIKKTIYNENDESIRNLEVKRDFLLNLIKDQAIGFLRSRKIAQESILKASERPKGVIQKYRELLGLAEKDKKTLDSLEIFYRNVLLEEAKTEDPWELITTPTMLNYPVYPSKKIYVIYFFLFGSFFASLLVLLIEKRNNIIFDSNKFREKFNLTFITELSAISEKIIAYDLEFLLKSSFMKNEEQITFLKESSIDDELINKNLEKIIKLKNHRILNLEKYIIENNLTNVILMPVLGKTKLNKLQSDISKLELLGVNIIGVVPINAKNEKNGIELKEEIYKLVKFLLSSLKIPNQS